MWVKIKDGKIENLNFTITMSGKCNLSCDYCPLINTTTQIKKEVLDEYLDFFRNNGNLLSEYTKSVVFVFFGGEPLLSLDSIKYFMEQAYYLEIPTRFVIYTNWTLLSEEIMDYIETFPHYRDRIIFYISIDGGASLSLEKRLSTTKQFDSLLKNIKLIKERGLNFSFSKVLFETDATTLFNSLCFLNTFKPEKLSFLPVSYYHKNGYSRGDIVQIIKGLELFIQHLLKEGHSELTIMEYLWLPDNVKWLKELYKADAWIYGDMDGDIYGIIDALPIFSLTETFTQEEKAQIQCGSIKNYNSLLEIIKNYDEFENRMLGIWKTWHEREYPNEIHMFGLIGMYFIKRLLIFKYKPQDAYEYPRSL